MLKAVEEFLIHGVKYAFPVRRGGATRGMPTAYAAPPLNDQIADNGDLPPVWPDAEGDVRGVTLEPLHKAAPKAARRDPELHAQRRRADGDALELWKVQPGAQPRSARNLLSLNFHMGFWTPGQAFDFLVDKVGHERDNATAEVRRSFESAQYENQPLYQAAYLLGGLQLRGLRKELVDSKAMTNKASHDEIMRQGNMPMALLRLRMTKQRLTRDLDSNWKFYGELPDK